ncbi:uncharacterized protein BDR25DRAFT_301375 [Lindgomyces ingoldianus]|uniref:Uncharacterized protein n=1 Tax=Lindgomyces ingoldianus TaxID=673940 RepID=A0ACB6R662_9PLEO|nr:uncharacterized protein BDR25DRAFT_301375 [Lindgomyces ingoldianus]KAF2474729.1 hypothetical protein BDR25DRAFT_301375 [Lindgomyces ingoldianus]
MGPLMGLSKLSRLSLLYLISTTIPTSQAMNLLSRQAATCGGMSTLAQCGSNFPSDFCCPKDTTCVSVNGTKSVSVICCPKGANCSFIQPITCDVSQLNATTHPDNQIHLSNSTEVKLPTCGGQCCPLGYTCNGGMCSANAGSPTSSPSSSAIPIATDAPAASQTTAAAPLPTPRAKQGFDGKSFAAGFFPGIVLGALLALGLLWAIKKRRELQERNRYSGDFGHVSRQISDPIYDPMYANRTDFIRRGSSSVEPSPNSATGMVPKNGMRGGGSGGMTPRIKSLFGKSPRIGFGGNSSFSTVPVPPPAVRAGNRDPYATPTRTPNRMTSRSNRTSVSNKGKRPLTTRSTSTETIDVLMPAPSFLEPPKAPGMRENRLTQDTTFTKLMERAGYEEDSREQIRDWKGSPANPR